MPKLDPSLVRQYFSYNPETGELRWKVDNKRARAGQLAGHVCAPEDGRIKVTVQYQNIWAHQIVWAYQTGQWATRPIDHIDHNPSNNRWLNLREVTTSQNIGNSVKANNKHGYRGVYWIKHLSKWGSRVWFKNRQYHCGTHSTPEDAFEAFKAKSNELRGEFSPYHQNLPSGANR